MTWKFLLLFVIFPLGEQLHESYDEALTLWPRSKFELGVDFRFSNVRNYTTGEESHFITFPRIIQEIVTKYDISKLTITMGQGRWNSQKWGIPPQPAATGGAQVFAVFKAENDRKADEKMKFLVEALNGILCTSLSQLSTVTAPHFVVFSKDEENYEQRNSYYKRYGILSEETTCTENLTRLRKLLACKQNGLSTLLHPSKLYNSIYHSSHLTVSHINHMNYHTIAMEVGVSVIFRSNIGRKQNWSLMGIFDRKLSSKCLIANSSVVRVRGRSSDEYFDIKKMLIDANQPLDVDIPQETSKNDNRIGSVWASQGGYEQRNGILTLFVQNGPLDAEVYVTQLMPYYVRTEYSKLKWSCNQKVQMILKDPAHSKSPTLLQFKLKMKSGQICELEIPFEKKLLRLEDYPPDANHGQHIPAAAVHFESSEQSYTVHSSAILVQLPVPDFSMPFNVICFVTTAFSLLFGPLNLYSTLWLAPMQRKKKVLGVLGRLLAIVLIICCLYAHIMDINLNEVRRSITGYLEKMNELR